MQNVTPDFFVTTISAAINACHSDRPVVLVGWSTGGYSALALAADAEFKRRVQAVISLSGFARGAWRGWLGIWQHLAAWKIHRLSFHAVLRTLQLSERLHVAIASSFLGQPGNRQLRNALSQSGMHHELQQHKGSALQILMGGIRSSNLTNQLSSIQCPVTIINGLCDPVIPAEEARHLHQHIPTSTLTLLDHVGHMLLIEARAEVLNQIEEQLCTILK